MHGRSFRAPSSHSRRTRNKGKARQSPPAITIIRVAYGFSFSCKRYACVCIYHYVFLFTSRLASIYFDCVEVHRLSARGKPPGPFSDLRKDSCYRTMLDSCDSVSSCYTPHLLLFPSDPSPPLHQQILSHKHGSRGPLEPIIPASGRARPGTATSRSGPKSATHERADVGYWVSTMPGARLRTGIRPEA